MRVGVTGSTGLIGEAVVRALTARGDEVIRFIRPSSPAVDGPSVRWDPARHTINDEDLARLGGLDGVVNLAGTGIADHRWSTRYRAAILTSRTDATATIASLATRLPDGLPTLVSGSAIGYYGNAGDRVLDEQAANGSDYLAEVCRQWEEAASVALDHGVHVSHLRTGIVLSRRGGALKKLLPIFRMGLGGDLGNGRQWMSPISLRDEVRAILFVLDHRLVGSVNVVAPTPCTNHGFSAALAGALRRLALVRVPAIAMKVALGAECASETVLTSQRVVPGVLQREGFNFLDLDVHAAIASALTESD